MHRSARSISWQFEFLGETEGLESREVVKYILISLVNQIKF